MNTSGELITDDPSVISKFRIVAPTIQHIESHRAMLLGAPIGDDDEIDDTLSKKSKSFSAWRVESNNFVPMMFFFSFEKLFQFAKVTVYSALCTMLQKPCFTKIRQHNPRNATAHFKH